MAKIRLLIVDDSALIRQMLTQIFSSSKEIEVVGTAVDPIVAREKIKKLNPDVLTLDIEMPRMDGLTFLRKLMRLRPMPVVMISTLTEKGAAVTLEALALGAVDIVAKPKVDVFNSLNKYAEEIIAKVKMAAKAQVHALDVKPIATKGVLTAPVKHSADAIIVASPAKKHFKTTDKIIVLGASTGGTEAIKQLVIGLPNTAPAIVIFQHLPAAFSASFARHVDDIATQILTLAT